MSDRIRLVVMGDSRVGKSSIVKRFLFGEFNIKHIPTVEGNHLILIIAAKTHLMNIL